MKLVTRRIVYMGAFLVFILAGFFLVGYAAGYRIDIQSGGITKVGAFFVKSYPAGAAISINGRATKKLTPNRILNLRPGRQRVTVTMPGFAPWEKTLEVKRGETTFILDIVLFRSPPTAHVLSTGGTTLLTSDGGTVYVFLGSEGNIHLTNLESQNHFVIIPAVKPDRLLALSPRSEEVLFIAQNRLYRIDLNTEKLTPVTERRFFDKNLSAQWDPGNPQQLWIRHDRVLSTYRAGEESSAVRFTGIDTFFLTNSAILTASWGDNRTTIKKYAYGDDSLVWTQTIRTTEHPAIVTAADEGLITLQAGGAAWLVSNDPGTAPLAFDAQHLAWHGDKLLLGTDFEISYYQSASGQNDLIDRTAETMRALAWHPNGSYFLRTLGAELQIVELDDRDVRNIAILGTVTGPFETVFDRKGETLFVVTPEENLALEIQ